MNIIPKPQKMRIKPGFFRILAKSRIKLYPFSIQTKKIAEQLVNRISQSSCLNPAIIPGVNLDTSDIHLQLDHSIVNKEGYILKINARYVLLKARDEAGLFYGIQTLLQLLPVGIFGTDQRLSDTELQLPVCDIDDYPHFSWRGLHLDVSRHFFPITFIKRYIDILAMHKMNKFHWHLTDDNGWRIEIKSYPKLQSISAWRVDRSGIDWLERKPAKPEEPANYGGYYTQKDIKEIVQYAADRYIEVIPEIEMPGHSCEVLAAYPELGCFNEPVSVAAGAYWPNKDILCAGKEAVFNFLQSVLEEVIALFPSRYIHIGGDEASKSNWKHCPDCLQRMESEHLENVDQLQSWFIKRIEKFLQSKGKQIIGWDEILEGGLAPGATVMSWRGMEGGISAADAGHDVIMTPGTHCYFDHYQGDPLIEKRAIGGYTTLRKVYLFDPVPSQLAQDKISHILGAQGNVWTEWMETSDHVEYMALPRTAALSEALWNYHNREWLDFRKRIDKQFKRYEFLGYNYCPGTSIIDINPEFLPMEQRFHISLDSEHIDYPIYYTLDGSEPDSNSLQYKKPFILEQSALIKAIMYVDNKPWGNVSKRSIIYHSILNKQLELSSTPNTKFAPTSALTDGLTGSLNHNDGCWCGFLGKDLTIKISWDHDFRMKKFRLNCLNDARSWIFLPTNIKLIATTSDSREKMIQEFSPTQIVNIESKEIETFFWEGDVTLQSLTIEIEALKRNPIWHIASGDPCWLFLDEIVLE